MPPFLKKNSVLWTVQTLLALVFLLSGGMKLVLPIEMLKGPVALPDLFMRFIGVAEVAGALGLILPGLLSIRRGLTPLAALGLVMIMTGATVITIMGGMVATALLPFVVGVLSALVVYGRSDWAGAGPAGAPKPLSDVVPER
jgi:DoxX-like family